MKWVALALVAFAAFAAAGVGDSKAADGCGRGWYWNGYRCAPRQAYREYRYGYDYAPGRRYYRGGGYNTWNGCPPGYTVQDGICKPYRGF